MVWTCLSDRLTLTTGQKTSSGLCSSNLKNRSHSLAFGWMQTNLPLYTTSQKLSKSLIEEKYGSLPFYPGKTYLYGGSGLPPPDAIHADGTEEFNVRGMVALLQCKYTYEYLKQTHPFPFVLTRSSMFGTGRYALTWLADYLCDLGAHEIFSIGTLSTINMFGITFVGTDLCGFVGHDRVEIELCARWYQLGAFYPFSKNGHAPTNAYYNSQGALYLRRYLLPDYNNCREAPL